ncbi:aldo/keto reductase [Flexivirga sp. ID2601S]|uniref:Aldo/keto reductase n=1 Tax=Flexivirga aerilata TaxID=1656889 RepID=A0A849AGS0_9MICO|nr:aldo/keto reductase [Flexivirga aerilata]NNG38756.1 aldo/keto reductase [Flexivirga aerilata]
MTQRRAPLPRRPGVQLTRLGLGAATLGNLYTPVSDEAADLTCAAAAEAGIEYVDTAPHYGLGLSERRVARWLSREPGVVVSTKVGRLLEPVDPPYLPDDEGFAIEARFRRVRDYSATGIRRSLESSLERLGIDRLGIVLLHDPDDVEEQAMTESIPALVRLRDEGLVDAIGVGMNQSAMLARFVERTDIDLVMCAGRFTLLEQAALGDLLPAALEHGVGVVAAGVFNSGILAEPRPPDDATYDYFPAPKPLLDKARRVAAVCADFGVSLPAAAVHLPLQHPAVVSVVLGMRSPDEVRADASYVSAEVPDELWAALVREGLLPDTVLGSGA